MHSVYEHSVCNSYQITIEMYKSVSELCLIHIDSEVIYFVKLELRYEKLACAIDTGTGTVAVAAAAHLPLICQQWNLYLQI